MTMRTAAIAAATALGLAASAMPASAEFFGWYVSGVASWDVLNVRAAPASAAPILVGYPNGAPLSLTGNCTGGLNLNAINGWPKWKQAQTVRFRWCEAWVDPIGNGNFQSGWVYGKYIRPM